MCVCVRACVWLHMLTHMINHPAAEAVEYADYTSAEE